MTYLERFTVNTCWLCVAVAAWSWATAAFAAWYGYGWFAAFNGAVGGFSAAMLLVNLKLLKGLR